MKSLHSIGSGLCEVLSASSTHSATPTFYTARAKDGEEQDMDNESDTDGDGLGSAMKSSRAASKESVTSKPETDTPTTATAPTSSPEPSSDSDLPRPQTRQRSSKHSSRSSISRRIPLRASSTRYSYTCSRHTTDPYLIHQRGKHLFSSLEGTLASFHAPSAELREPLITTSPSSSPKLPPSTVTSASYPASPDPEKSDPLPCTTIDWTQPATRRREYAEIDASHRGLRGLFRRLTPRWCQGQQRLQFYDERKNGSGSDCGSVRRYRLDLPDEKETRIQTREVRSGVSRSRNFWSCFGSASEDEE